MKDKKILISEFQEKTFLEEKAYLLDLLSGLPQDNEKVIDLLEIVNSTSSNENTDILIEVFDIIIDGVISSSNKTIEDLGKMLERARNIILKIRKLEEEEKSKIDFEAILAQLYN